MENMGLTVPKWVLIVWPKIPQMPQNLSAQFVFPIPKVKDFNEKRLHWASVVRGSINKDTNLLISFVDIVTNSWSEIPISFRVLIGFDKISS